MSFGFGFALPAYPLRGGGGNNPFNQLGPTLDLSFVGTAGDLSGADTYTLNTDFITPEYQVAAQYAIWENGVGLAQKTFSQIVTFSRTSGATWFNSAGVNVGIDFSTSSVAIGTGSKTFTLTATAGVDRSWTAGDIVRISEQATPANFMDGTVTSYTASTQTLVVNVTATGGSGTIASWRVSNWMPRFDYNPATLAAQGLLIEEQRTNLMLQSQFVSGWTASAGTLTTNVTASPDGTTNAASFIEDSTNAARSINQSSQSFTAGATLTASLFVKQTGGATRHFRVQISSNAGANGFRAYFNLATNSVSLQTAGFGTGTAVANSATITPVGNGWYRISASGTVDPAATVASGMGFMQDTPSGAATYTGDGTSGLFIWGAQLEAGAFPTSYITTTVAAVTRNRDEASVNTLSPWFNSTSGTLYAEYAVSGFAPASAFPSTAALSDGTGNNRINLASTNTGASLYSYGEVQAGGAPQAGFYGASGSSFGVGTARKVAIAYAVNDFAFTTQGLAVQADPSGTVPTVDRLYLGVGSTGTAQFQNGYLRRIVYYPRRLPNADLQTITT